MTGSLTALYLSASVSLFHPATSGQRSINCSCLNGFTKHIQTSLLSGDVAYWMYHLMKHPALPIFSKSFPEKGVVDLSQSKPKNKRKHVLWQPAGMPVVFGEVSGSVKSDSSESDPKPLSEMTQWQLWESGSRSSLAGLKKQHRSMLPEKYKVQQSRHMIQLWASMICKHAVAFISVWKEANTDIYGKRSEVTVMLKPQGPSWEHSDVCW